MLQAILFRVQLSTIIFLIFFSCSSIAQNSRSKTQQIKPDTLVTKGKEVIFFKPTKDEFEKLKKGQGIDSGLDEVESDYNYYATKIQDKLKERNISFKYSIQRVIKIITFNNSVSYLNRITNETSVYGIIINSSVFEPTILFGVNTDVDILMSLE